MTLTKTLDKRTKIIETALELFTTQGLQQTSMAQLSKESGVAVGTIYLNFKSKDELIEGIFLHVQNEFGKAILLTDDELELPFEQIYYLIGRRAYNYYVEHPNKFYFIDTHNYSPLISKDVREEGRNYYQQAIGVLLSGIKKNIFKDIHPVLMIRWVYNGIITLVQLKLNDDVEVTEEMIDRTLEMTWNGLQ